MRERVAHRIVACRVRDVNLDRAIGEDGTHPITDARVGEGIARRSLGRSATELGLVLLANGG